MKNLRLLGLAICVPLVALPLQCFAQDWKFEAPRLWKWAQPSPWKWQGSQNVPDCEGKTPTGFVDVNTALFEISKDKTFKNAQSGPLDGHRAVLVGGSDVTLTSKEDKTYLKVKVDGARVSNMLYAVVAVEIVEGNNLVKRVLIYSWVCSGADPRPAQWEEVLPKNAFDADSMRVVVAGWYY